MNKTVSKIRSFAKVTKYKMIIALRKLLEIDLFMFKKENVIIPNNLLAIST